MLVCMSSFASNNNNLCKIHMYIHNTYIASNNYCWIFVMSKCCIVLEFMMSSENTSSPPGIPENAVSALEDLDKAPIPVQLDAHNPIPNGQDNSGGMNHVFSEEKDVLVSLPKQTFNMSTESLTSQSSLNSGNAVSLSIVKEKEGSFVVQMIDNTEKATSLSSRYTKLSPTKRPSLLCRLSLQDKMFSRQESQRRPRKDAGTFLKDVKNYISFHNITYTVPQGWFFQHKPPKVVLNNVRLVT